MACPRRANRYTEAERAEMVDLYRGGMRSGEITARYGVDQTTLSGWVRKAGVPPQRNGQIPRPLPSVYELWQLFRQHGSWREVSRQLGAPLSTVQRRANAEVVP